MPWLLLLLALAAFGLAWYSTSMLLMAASLVAALGLVLAGTLALRARQVAGRREAPPRDDAGGA